MGPLQERRLRGRHGPDQHPVLGGTRIPLILFGGRFKQGIESNWHSHACIPKTVSDLFGLGRFGVPRVHTARSLADRVDSTLTRDLPPPFGSAIQQPTAPVRAPAPVPPAPWEGPDGKPMPALVGNGGVSIPAPDDATVSPPTPRLPAGLSAAPVGSE